MVTCKEIRDGWCVQQARNLRGNHKKGDLRLSGPQSGQGAGGGAQTRDRRVPADLRADSLATVPPTPTPTPTPIRQRQLQFLGHICRHSSFKHLAITGKIEGNHSRQRITFIKSLNSWAIGNGSNISLTRLLRAGLSGGTCSSMCVLDRAPKEED
ncbi:hypothetical protein PoB_004568400 [Plakobranchus ocellatus]|uniref:Uncharacterized protein n=1 Tax=Plakobranchus ocellatus TaxID=259542 RepID=A0AAV4BJT6_9GAST|nr:hypothetical protein PoB_004568400 [Plakobranchus ocellatus]